MGVRVVYTLQIASYHYFNAQISKTKYNKHNSKVFFLFPVVVYFEVADDDHNFCFNNHHSVNFQVNANLVSSAGKKLLSKVHGEGKMKCKIQSNQWAVVLLENTVNET